MVNIVSTNQNNNILVKSVFRNISGILFDLYYLYTTSSIKLVSGSNIKNFVDNILNSSSNYDYYYSINKSLLYMNTNNITQSNMNISNTANKSFDNKIFNSTIVTSSGTSGFILNSLGILVSNTPLHLLQQVILKDTYMRSLYSLDINYKYFNISLNPTFNSSSYTYITTIGLYDLNNNLLAVGRLNKPVKNVKNYQNIIKVSILL